MSDDQRRPRHGKSGPGRSNRPASRPDWRARRAAEVEDGVILYGWHPVVEALSNPRRRIRRLLVTENALRRLTASRLAALNHGAVTAFAPGMEASTVLSKVRAWAETVGEIHIGEGADPVVSIELAGVDYDSVLERVANEDTESARRTMLKRLVFADLGVDDSGMLPTTTWPVVWRGSRRSLELVFGNIRDESVLPDDLLRAGGESWKVVVDYPFDAVGHGPQDDVNRFAALAADGVTSRTVGWVPSFLTAARQVDVGKLVLLEHLLGGTGEQFDRHAAHLPVDQRPIARTALARRWAWPQLPRNMWHAMST